MTPDLKSRTLITLVYMCMLPLTAILVAFEAMAASKRPRRSFEIRLFEGDSHQTRARRGGNMHMNTRVIKVADVKSEVI